MGLVLSLLSHLLPYILMGVGGISLYFIIKGSGRKEQQLDDIKTSEKLQDKVDEVKPESNDNIEKDLNDGRF